MKHLKKTVVALAAAALPLALSAQSYDFRPYYFAQGQAGIDLPFQSGNKSDLMEPNYALNLGAWFTPSFGARVGVQGLSSNVGLNNKFYNYDKYTSSLDLMVNVLDLFAKGNNHKFNTYLIGGVGLTWAGEKEFKNSSSSWDLSHNLRVGAALEYKICKPLSVSVEYRLDNMADYVNGRLNNNDDWHQGLFLGLSVNFGYSKKLYSEAPEDVKLSLYEQMMVMANDKTNTWMKRLQGESKEDYLLRVNSGTIETQKLAFANEIATGWAGNMINKTASIGKYNRKEGLLGVDFQDMPSILIGVPATEISNFKNTKDLKFSNTVYGLNPDDKYQVLYTEVLNPVTGKTYIYNNLNRKDVALAETEGFTPLNVAIQSIDDDNRLQAITTNTLQEAKDRNILSDNTTIYVSTEAIPNGDKIDYKVNYYYTVNDEFSVKDDFAPGKYEADQSAASTAMLKIIKESFDKDFGKYIKEGKKVIITYTGSADGSPVNRTISYNGRYGNIENLPVMVNGKMQSMTVTKASGINSNEELSLVRAVGVKNYIYKNVPSLSKMNTEDKYAIEVSPNVGAKFRRVTVTFLFSDAF